MTRSKATFAAFVLAASSSAFAQDAPGDWVMDGGGPARTSFVDVAPIANAPVEVWRRKPDEGWIGEPVVADGVLYVGSRTSGGFESITALNVRTGALVARVGRLKRPAVTLRLATSRGLVVAVAPDLVEGFAVGVESLYSKWKHETPSLFTPCIFQGVAFFGRDACDVASGRWIESLQTWTPGIASAATSVAPLPGDRATKITPASGPHASYSGAWLCCRVDELARCSGGASTINIARVGATLPVAQYAAWNDVQEPITAVGVRLEATTPGEPGAWIVAPDARLSTPSGKSGGLVVHVDKGANELVPGVARPAVCGGVAYSFDLVGNLIAIHADGRWETVAANDDLPLHAPASRPTAARGTLYVENWAFDLATKKATWSKLFAAKDHLVGPTIPVGDGLVVIRTDAGEIVCLGDPQRPATVRPKPVAKPAGPPPLPTAGDGVILRDGRQILGAVRSDGLGRVLVSPKDGEAQEFPIAEVLCAESGGVVLAAADERTIVDFWNAALRGVVADRLEAAAAVALELSLVSQSAAWVEQARKWGLPEARVAEWKKKFARRKDGSYGAGILAERDRRTVPLFDACIADVTRGVAWCGARGFAVAGGVLAGRIAEIDGGSASIEKVAASVAPALFRERTGDADAGKRWIAWAKFMLRADASLLDGKDPAWRRVTRAPWTERTLGFRTPNLLFFTRCADAGTAGPCLARGEAAVRGLRRLLGGDVPDRAADDDDRLEVRLHADRADYLAEAGPGADLIAFTLGYYSPPENVSRFYVPDAGAKPLDVERGLSMVLAHELTHHYVEGRWLASIGVAAKRTLRTPGYWVVEGIAVFVADQIGESETRGLTFEEPRVMSVYLASKALGYQWMPIATFLDLDKLGTNALGDTPQLKWAVWPPGGMQPFSVSETEFFYDVGGALVFYLRNARGDAGRGAFTEYLRGYYAGTLGGESWKALGFNSAEALEAAFAAWLKSLKW